MTIFQALLPLRDRLLPVYHAFQEYKIHTYIINSIFSHTARQLASYYHYPYLKESHYNSNCNQCPEINVGHLWCDKCEYWCYQYTSTKYMLSTKSCCNPSPRDLHNKVTIEEAWQNPTYVIIRTADTLNMIKKALPCSVFVQSKCLYKTQVEGMPFNIIASY